jgi:methionyl-tRNA formyltransferase
MKVAIIGRTEIMYETALLLLEQGHEIAIIITSKEAPEYTKTSEDFKQLALKINSPYYNTSKINSPLIVEKLNELQCDIAVSINYSGIIPQLVIDTFKYGILNAHGGDLPRYRGNACQAWAILNGEEKIGLCIYKMRGDYLDGGEIIFKEFLPIDINTTITQVFQWFNRVIPSLFCDAINILQKTPNYYIEDSLKSSVKSERCYPRNEDDGRINWFKSNFEIIRLINASCEPYSGAFCYFSNLKVKILKAILHNDDEHYYATPGQICAINTESIDVITGNGKIRILEIEIDSVRKNPHMLTNSIRTRLT